MPECPYCGRDLLREHEVCAGACDTCIGRGDDRPEDRRPNEADEPPDPDEPPRRYSKAWMRERLSVQGDSDD